MYVGSSTYYVFSRASTKERSKPRSGKIKLKPVNYASFCKSLVFCYSCRKFSQCCSKSTCGECLKDFWQTWASKGARSRVVSILKNGYNLSFNVKPPLTRIPLVKSGYASPLRFGYLQEALYSLFDKWAIEMVKLQSSLAFYDCFFLVPKPSGDRF